MTALEPIELMDCPCGGWDCTAAPEGPMHGCPYAKPVCDHGKLQDGQICPACGCMGNGEAIARPSPLVSRPNGETP